MGNSLGNNFSDRRRDIDKSYRNEFADEIVAKISKCVDLKKFLQAVFAEKILTEKQEEILKLLYGFDDGIIKNTYQVVRILWISPGHVAKVRWDAFKNILQSEVYKDLFPEENGEKLSLSDDVVKQKREKILQNLNDDLDNYEYYIDDLLALENMEISEESDIIEMLKNKKIREILIKTLSREKFVDNARAKEIFMDVYGFRDWITKTYLEVGKRFWISDARVDEIQKRIIMKILRAPGVREELFEIWQEE